MLLIAGCKESGVDSNFQASLDIGSGNIVLTESSGADSGSSSGSGSEIDVGTTGSGSNIGSDTTGSGPDSSSGNPDTNVDIEAIAPFKFYTNESNQSFIQYQCEEGQTPSEICGQVKEVGFCLNCVGSKSPEIGDFFNNIGEGIMSCPDFEFPVDFTSELFVAGELIPITAVSQYNPNKLQDAALATKFASLCPNIIEEPVVLAVVNRLTRAITQVPLVLCGNKVYPLTGATVRCDESAKAVMAYVEKNLADKADLEEHYSHAIEEPQFIKVAYDVVALSDFLEGQFIRCGKDSSAICQKICNSKLSCVLPLDMEKNLKSILAFDSSKLKICDGREINFESLLSLIQGKDTFVFSHQSLNLQYEGIPNTDDFHDFSVINGILNDFNGIFQTDRDWKEDEYRTFLFSPAYRSKVKAKLAAFCRANETTYIMGRDGNGELALCQSDTDLRVLVLAKDGEDCQVAGNKLGAFGPIVERTGH